MTAKRDARFCGLRQGRKQDVVVRMGSLQEAAQYAAGAIKERFGAEVRAVTAKETEKLGLNAKQGVALSWIDP